MPNKIQNKLKMDYIQWGRPQNLYQINSLLEIPVKMPQLEVELKATKLYILDRNGLSVDCEGKTISDSSRKYLWGVLEGRRKKNSDEPLFVWKTLSKDGKFRNMQFGTRKDFDKIIAKELNNNQ